MDNPVRVPSRAARVVGWILRIVLALGFVGAALQKLTGDPQAVASFDALGWGFGPRAVIAALEILGAIALVVPGLCGLAAPAFVALMVGATVVQAITGNSVVPPLIYLVLSAILTWLLRHQSARMWHRMTRRRHEVVDPAGPVGAGRVEE